jgi:hypothetical protein
MSQGLRPNHYEFPLFIRLLPAGWSSFRHCCFRWPLKGIGQSRSGGSVARAGISPSASRPGRPSRPRRRARAAGIRYRINCRATRRPLTEHQRAINWLRSRTRVQTDPSIGSTANFAPIPMIDTGIFHPSPAFPIARAEGPWCGGPRALACGRLQRHFECLL